ncbi:WXG100 family type VII secretion target [Mycobacterium frederiksbergense]|uniref:WXG100 family type VII secretion target n=1 Tax=Mycolicibacterium frederiksbergense TaxID=117567 RepID=A0ABT6KX36_9MYCO|nr:ESX-1 secretion-associated protein [Mycolicibacterium frederiksbergense]MDH6195283.1 WXG100 family type VII secretion target [Mycolicibacterium frederiksbergense]
MTHPALRVTPAEVRRSADQMDVTAHEASSSRKAMADGISGQTTAWKHSGAPGFAKFVEIVEAQAERLNTDLFDLRDKLRNAADVYERQDHEAGGALDSSVGGAG